MNIKIKGKSTIMKNLNYIKFTTNTPKLKEISTRELIIDLDNKKVTSTLLTSFMEMKDGALKETKNKPVEQKVHQLTDAEIEKFIYYCNTEEFKLDKELDKDSNKITIWFNGKVDNDELTSNVNVHNCNPIDWEYVDKLYNMTDSMFDHYKKKRSFWEEVEINL